VKESNELLGTTDTDSNGAATLEITAAGSVGEVVTLYATATTSATSGTIEFESNQATYTIIAANWNLVAGAPYPNPVQVCGQGVDISLALAIQKSRASRALPRGAVASMLAHSPAPPNILHRCLAQSR
jgi:hypothetical protein